MCRSSLFYITIIQRILAELGHSPDLVQIVVGFAPTGVALINSGIDKVAVAACLFCYLH